MKRIGALLLGLLLTGVFTLPAWAGSLTTNKFFYKPSSGARGDIEKKNFDASLDRIDARLGKEIWVGDPNYGTTLQDAITAIGTTNKSILRIPAGAWAINSYFVIPNNITLKFENGAYLNLSGLPSTDIQGMASSGTVTVITWTGHGLNTGDYVTFNGIRQYYPGVTPTYQSSGAWMNFNDRALSITKIDNDSFSVAVNSSGTSYSFATYNPATDPGIVSAVIRIQGEIDAGLQQIFSQTGEGTKVWIDNAIGKNINIYPEWFGAVADDATDDLVPIKKTISAGKVSGRAVVRLSNLYYVSDTVSLNDNQGKVHVKGIANSLTGFRSKASGYPAFEVLGTWAVEFADFCIIGNNRNTAIPTSLVPSVAIMEGRSMTNPNTGNYSWNNIQIRGFFQYGEIYNQGNGLVKYNNIDSIVKIPAPGYGIDNRKFGLCFTDSNKFGLAGRNADLSIWTSIGMSLCWITDSQFSGSGFGTGGQAPCPTGTAAYLLYNASSMNFNNVYTGAMTAPGADGSDVWQFVDSYGLNLKNCQIESNHRYTINISSTTPTQRRKNISAVNITGSSTHEAFLIVDSNTSLNNCYFADGQTSSSKTILGGGSEGSTFLSPYGMTGFTCLAGNFQNNTIELGFDCKVFDVSGCGNLAYNNLIRDKRAFSNQTLIDGNLTVGQPHTATPSTITVSPYKMTWAAAAPTSGSYAQGSVIWKIGAAAGTSPGWNCRLDNTFGTLNSGATTGTITTGTKLLTVNSVSGLTIGNFIDVVADGGGNAVTAGRIVNIDSTNKIVTLYANAIGTATDTAVSFHNHTTAEAFEAMPSTLARTSGVTGAITTGTAVTHGLGTTPTKVLLTSVDGVPTGIYPNTFGTSTFAINFAGGGSHAFYWEAIQ